MQHGSPNRCIWEPSETTKMAVVEAVKGLDLTFIVCMVFRLKLEMCTLVRKMELLNKFSLIKQGLHAEDILTSIKKKDETRQAPTTVLIDLMHNIRWACRGIAR